MDVMIPSIFCSIDGHEQATNLLSYDLIKNRRVQIRGEINDAVAYSVTSQIRYLEGRSAEPITLEINSPGGSVSAGLEIYDAMKSCSCEIHTLASGIAASMGAFLLAAGTKGMRLITPNTEVMIHQPLGGAQGQASDILIQARHIERIRASINRILAAETGQDLHQIELDTERDTYMTAEDAVEYGVVDTIYTG